MTSHPEPTVGVLILNSKEEVLLVKTHKWKNKYGMPGGHIKVGETVEDAVKREVEEETGIKDVHDIKFLCWQECVLDDEFHKEKHFIFLDYCCKTDSKDIVLNNEAEEHIWVPIEKALELPLNKFSKRAVEEYINKYIKKQ